MDTEKTQTPETQQTEAPSLQLADLVAVVNLIQVVAQRGAVHASEMAVVGNIYDRLSKFLVASGAMTVAKEPAQEETQNG